MGRTMMAAVYDKDGKIRVRDDYPKPEIRDIFAPMKYSKAKILLKKEELVLLRVKAASICGTDLRILAGEHGSYPPVILGHEYVGTVIERGESVTNVKEGDFVAVDPNIKCGYCEFCLKDMPNMCENLTTLGIFLDGGFAEYNIAPAKQLYKLPDAIPLERAVLFEPLSCVLHGFSKIWPLSERALIPQTALIFGAGPIGLCFVMLCSKLGYFTTVVEPKSFRRAHIKKFDEFRVAIVKPNTEGLKDETFDVVIDACGDPNVVTEAIKCAKRNGKVLFFGQQGHAPVKIDPTMINQKELRVLGSYVATQKDFARAVEMLSQNLLPLEQLITHRVTLEGINKAFDLIKAGKALKILISPSGGDR